MASHAAAAPPQQTTTTQAPPTTQTQTNASEVSGVYRNRADKRRGPACGQKTAHGETHGKTHSCTERERERERLLQAFSSLTHNDTTHIHHAHTPSPPRFQLSLIPLTFLLNHAQHLVLRLKKKKPTTTGSATAAAAAEGAAAEGSAADGDARVRWAESTVDNEHLGRKSSKCTPHGGGEVDTWDACLPLTRAFW